jgi:hypothetical protein
MKKNDLIMYGAIAAGAFGVWWYITSYGPQGAVKDANGNLIPGTISYWDSWFGATATTTAAVSAPAPAPAPAQVMAPAQQQLPPAQTQAPAPPPAQPQPISAYVPPSAPGVMATPVEIAYIQSLIQPSDLPAFQAMIPTLTSAQALAIIAKAQTCPMQARMPGGDCGIVAPNIPDQAPVWTNMTIRNRLAIAAGTTTGLTASQWNFYYDRLALPNAQSGPALGDNGQPMDIDTYISLRGKAGVGAITPVPSASSGGLSGSPWGPIPQSTKRRYLN